jgi:hypothetical protein
LGQSVLLSAPISLYAKMGLPRKWLLERAVR